MIEQRNGQSTYTVRHYNPETLEEYQAIVDVYNQVWPDNLNTAAEWQHNNSQWPDTHLFQRYVGTLGGRIIAEGALMEPRWAYVPGKYLYGYSVLPEYGAAEIDGQTIHDVVYAFIIDFLAGRSPTALMAYVREDKAIQVQWLQDHGFREAMREPVSQLDVSGFDASRFDDVSRRVASSGIQIVPLSTLQERDVAWLQKTYDLWTEVDADVPSTDPVTPEPFEQFEKIFSDPNFLAEGWFIAVDGTGVAAGEVGPYVGITSLGLRQAEPEKLKTWLTGVRMPYRRRGIALAMKVHAIVFSERRGIKVIETENEENNPMYQNQSETRI